MINQNDKRGNIPPNMSVDGKDEEIESLRSQLEEANRTFPLDNAYKNMMEKERLELKSQLLSSQGECGKMREALEAIMRHQETSTGGSGVKLSTTWNIAKQALSSPPPSNVYEVVRQAKEVLEQISNRVELYQFKPVAERMIKSLEEILK